MLMPSCPLAEAIAVAQARYTPGKCRGVGGVLGGFFRAVARLRDGNGFCVEATFAGVAQARYTPDQGRGVGDALG